MKIAIRLSVILLFALVIKACVKENLPPLVAPDICIATCSDSAIAADTTIITYTNVIDPIISLRCGFDNEGCHSSQALALGNGYPLTTYDEVLDYALSGRLMCQIEGTCGIMPPPMTPWPKLTPDTIQIIADWINNCTCE